MSGYCPAGKCECEKYDNEYCHYGRTPLAPIVFGVCPYFSERQQDAKLKEARTAGRLAGLREARGGVEQLAETHPDINVSADNGWVKLSVILAAIDRLMGGK
jgi:hypothetical protein